MNKQVAKIFGTRLVIPDHGHIFMVVLDIMANKTHKDYFINLLGKYYSQMHSR